MHTARANCRIQWPKTDSMLQEQPKDQKSPHHGFVAIDRLDDLPMKVKVGVVTEFLMISGSFVPSENSDKASEHLGPPVAGCDEIGTRCLEDPAKDLDTVDPDLPGQMSHGRSHVHGEELDVISHFLSRHDVEEPKQLSAQ